MKKCPYCAEEIQDEAIKCRFCNEFLLKPKDYQNPAPQNKWYNNPAMIILAFLCVGPLALPMVWTNKKLSTQTKTIITVIMLVLTYFILVWTMQAGKSMIERYQALMEELNM